MRASNMSLTLRNTFRHRTRSAIALSAIAFGLIALVLANGFIECVYWATRESAIQNGLGHIQVMRPGYRDSGTANSLAYLLPESSPEFALLEETPEAKVVTPRLTFGGLISRGDMTLSFLGEGVDREREISLAGTHGFKWRGLAADPRGILPGQGLADNLGVKPSANVVLLATS